MTIHLTSPNGGESLAHGTRQTITWDFAQAAKHSVDIALLRRGQLIGTIVGVEAIGNNGHGSATWDVPLDITRSSGYTMTITIRGSSPPVTDSSDAVFSIS
jgi:hypothetical protein